MAWASQGGRSASAWTQPRGISSSSIHLKRVPVNTLITLSPTDGSNGRGERAHLASLPSLLAKGTSPPIQGSPRILTLPQFGFTQIQMLVWLPGAPIQGSGCNVSLFTMIDS